MPVKVDASFFLLAVNLMRIFVDNKVMEHQLFIGVVKVLTNFVEQEILTK